MAAQIGETTQQDELDVNVPKVNPVVVAQLRKTKMCENFAKGAWHDTNCPFAHSESELRPQLDLSKTAMCRLFAQGKCSDSICRYAHGEWELRVTAHVYKTQLCNFFSRGRCTKTNCRHAHGEQELRKSSSMQMPNSSSTSPSTQRASDRLEAGNPPSSPSNSAIKQCASWWLAASAATVNPRLEKFLQASEDTEAQTMIPNSLVNRAYAPDNPLQRAIRESNQFAVELARSSGRVPKSCDEASYQAGVAAQVAHAAVAELQAAMMKKRFQKTQTAELASVLLAARFDNQSGMTLSSCSSNQVFAHSFRPSLPQANSLAFRPPPGLYDPGELTIRRMRF